MGLGNPVVVEPNPPVSPFVKGGNKEKEKFPSLEKRGKGRFGGTNSPVSPFVKGGKKEKERFPSLEKRG
jgi:hypothetical protein